MGYTIFGRKKPDKNQITEMFSLLESRGRDAAGVGFIRDGALFVHKAPVRSSELIKGKEWQSLDLPETLIAHTRLKTQGTQLNNQNNHPLFNKAGICLVHNGMIHNDAEIFARNKRDAEVDSEAILAVLGSKAKGDKIKQVFDRLEGSFAFAMIDKTSPDRLVLVKKDNPIDLYLDAEDDILYFCSERSIMKEALGIESESLRGFNVGEGKYHFYSMENNHALIINREGVESYKRYTPKKIYSYYGYGSDYFGADAEYIRTECPWCLEMTDYHVTGLINLCQHCGERITEEDLYV